MEHLRKASIYLMCLAILVLPACEGMGLTSPQRDAARQSLANALNTGQITQAQYDAAIESINKPSITADDWANWLIAGGSVVASVLLGVPIAVGRVQAKRGPVATKSERVVRAAAAQST